MPQYPFTTLLGTRTLRKELGVPDYVSDATLADLLRIPEPPPIEMRTLLTPEQAILDWAPTAVRVAGGVGGGILAGVGGPVGPLAAGSVNVFADQIARKMEETNQQRVPSAQFESARVPAAFLGGVLQGMLPRTTGPLGYVQAGAENAGINALENAAEGRPFNQQETGMAALLGPAFHGTYQAGGKAAGAVLRRLVPMSVNVSVRPPTQGQLVPFSVFGPLMGEAGAFHINPPQQSESIFDRLMPDPKKAALNLSRRLNPRTTGSQEVKAPRQPVNKAIVFEDEAGKVYVGPLSHDQWFQKASDYLKTPEEWHEARNWYRDLFAEFRKHSRSDDEAKTKIIAWAASQQQASPSKGMQDVLRAGDVAVGLPEIKKAGLGADRLASILGGKPLEKGFGVKLYDFMDAATGKPTRTWMGDNPAGGQPAPIDVHAARDVGFVDQTTVDRIRERFGNRAANRLETDVVGAPSEHQTEYGNRYYESLASWLNQNKIMGGGWTPAETQAVGWVATLKQFGLPAESAKDIFSKNIRRISYEVSFGEGSPYSKEFKPLYELPYSQSKAITDDVGNFVAQLVAKETKSRLVSHTNEAGGYLQYPVQPSVQLDVLDSPETVRDVADSIGYLLQQNEMMISRTMPPTGKGIARPSDFAIDILPAKADDFRDGEVLQGFWSTLQGLLPDKFKGFAPYVHNGKLGIRIVDRDRAWKTKDLLNGGEVVEAIMKAGDAHNIDLGINPNRIEFEFSGHSWKDDPNGKTYLDSLRSRGRHDLAQRLVSQHRWTTRDQLAKAYQKHTQIGNQRQIPASQEALPQEVGYPSQLGERGPPRTINPPTRNNPTGVFETLLGKSSQ